MLLNTVIIVYYYCYVLSVVLTDNETAGPRLHGVAVSVLSRGRNGTICSQTSRNPRHSNSQTWPQAFITKGNRAPAETIVMGTGCGVWIGWYLQLWNESASSGGG